MKKKFVAFVIGQAIGAAALFGVQARANTPAVYPQTFAVCDIDRAADVVTLCTSTGLLYQMGGAEDWERGDIVAAIMDDNGTPDTVLDDVILQARYTGTADSYNK